ncbi:MAG TPA: ABC-type transport auxiliary lipoprotein family protein [Gallionellaceae bacterium]
MNHSIRCPGLLCMSAACVATLLLAGCISFPGQQAERQTLYRLDAQLPGTVSVARRDAVLAISMPQAQPGAQSAAMAYVQQAHQVDYYVSSRWADTPARMLEPLLLQALTVGGGFRAVVSNDRTVAADYRLDSEWLRLQQEFGQPPSRMHLTLRVQLVNLHTRQVVAAQEIDEVEPADSENAHGGVMAANRAMQRVLGRVVTFCADNAVAR